MTGYFFLRYHKYLELRDSYYELHGLQRSSAGRNAFFYKRLKSENMRPGIEYVTAISAENFKRLLKILVIDIHI